MSEDTATKLLREAVESNRHDSNCELALYQFHNWPGLKNALDDGRKSPAGKAEIQRAYDAAQPPCSCWLQKAKEYLATKETTKE